MNEKTLQASKIKFCFYGPYTRQHFEEMLKKQGITNGRIEHIVIDWKEPTMASHKFCGIQKVNWMDTKIELLLFKTLQAGKNHDLAMVTRSIIEIATEQIISATVYLSPGKSTFDNFDKDCGRLC